MSGKRGAAQLLVLLLARARLRRGEACGLRRGDIHLLPDSRMLGCAVERRPLHVVRRYNGSGAWRIRDSGWCRWTSWSCRRSAGYEFERLTVPAAADSEVVLVNLFREPIGGPMRPDASTSC